MTRYIYFRDYKTSSEHKGIICVGYQIEPSTNNNEGYLKIALAYCNPKDRFEKKIAHKILKHRFENSKYHTILIPINEIKYKEIVDIVTKYLFKIFLNFSSNEKHRLIFGTNIPSWAKEKISFSKVGHLFKFPINSEVDKNI